MKLFLTLLMAAAMADYLPAQSKKAFFNGKIYTVNEKQPLAEAVVTEGNKIIFVGSQLEMKSYIDERTEMIDLGGKLMLPGFIDNHVHFVSGGFYLDGVDLRPAASIPELQQILSDYVKKHEGEWITGGEWDHEAWDVKELPTKEMIDDFTPETPVFVTRFDGHMGLANSYALRLAGITKDTPSPDGGVIVKDPQTGEPTGILKDNAMSLVNKIIPEQSDDEIYNLTVIALNEAKRLGITSVQDITYSSHLRAYKKLDDEGKLTCRIYTRMPIAEYSSLPEGVQFAGGSEKIKTGSLKAFADGSLGSSTAWFFDKYQQDTTTFGLAMDIVSDGRLEDWALDADRRKLQLSIHAIGDRANSHILDLFENIIEKNPEWDRRFRIEHAQHVRFEDIGRFKELGVIASCQPYHAIDDGVWAEKRIGAERIKYTYPFRNFIDEGVVLSFGSDWVVAPLNPLLGIYAAVTRKTLDDKNPGGWIPEQKITVEEAVKCYTLNNAYAAFEEDIKGSIEQGKLADMVVLRDDIFTIDPEKIKNTSVILTVFDGEIIFEVK
jgi:predicted amidohydrolase YtcJ